MQHHLSNLLKYLSVSGIETTDLSGNDSAFDHVRLSTPSEGDTSSLYIFISGSRIRLQTGSSFFDAGNTGSYSTVCEAVFEALHYYENWEKEMLVAALRDSDYQRIIDIADTVFNNPVFLCNWQGNVLGFSKKYADADISPTWQTITGTYRVPLNCLGELLASEYRDTVYQENSIHLLRFPERNHTSIFGLVHVHHEIVLQFQIIEYDNKLTQADINLAAVFLNALRNSFHENSLTDHESALSVFRDIVSGKEVQSGNLEWALDYLGWRGPGSHFHIALLTKEDGSVPDRSMNSQIEYNVPGSKVIESSNHLIMILIDESLSHFNRELNYACGVLRLFCSVSTPLSEWSDLRDKYNEAVFCLSFCSADNRLVFCCDHTWDVFLDSVSRNPASAALIHPVVNEIIRYDQEHRTAYAETLYQYLLNERSTVDTAAALFIHRNTLQYRLNRITEMYSLDLDSPEIRMHLIISFAIRKVLPAPHY